jgi:hypothetical protein
MKAVLRHNPSKKAVDRSGNLMTESPPTCPHCGSRLKKWLVPEDASWSDEFFFVCFNDGCSYYREGWEWMKQRYNQTASYRCAFNPTTGEAFMIPVWSDAATREMIVEEPQGDQP